jgi:hypothetical protein
VAALLLQELSEKFDLFEVAGAPGADKEMQFEL